MTCVSIQTNLNVRVDVAKRTLAISHPITNIIPPIKQTQIVHAAQIVRDGGAILKHNIRSRLRGMADSFEF